MHIFLEIVFSIIFALSAGIFFTQFRVDPIWTTAAGILAIISSIFTILQIFQFIASTSLFSRQTNFAFEVCNRSNNQISVAVSHYSSTSAEWIMEGWWTVNANNCSNIGRFQMGNFYYYANGNPGPVEWPGSFPLCVEIPGPFKRVNIPNSRCRTENERKQFNAVFVQTEKYTVNLTN